MDARQLAVFTADMRSQLQLIRQVSELLDARLEGLQRENAVCRTQVGLTSYRADALFSCQED